VLTWWEFTVTPPGFVPSQDMGYLLLNVQLPDAGDGEGAGAEAFDLGAHLHQQLGQVADFGLQGGVAQAAKLASGDH